MKTLRESCERGAAAVEFALIAILLLSMFFAIIEGGRLFYLQASLAAAARDGAREMAIYNDETRAEDAVNDIFTPFGDVTGPTIGYNPSPPDCSPGDSITVIATAEAALLTGIFGEGPITITGVGEMRCGG
jgi:Flp pilus assembly pilin Flp